jgi:hypothetical protein
MNFLLFYILSCVLHYLVIRLTITTGLIFTFEPYSNDTFISIIMPGTTRSRAKLWTGLPILCSLLVSQTSSSSSSTPNDFSNVPSSTVPLVTSGYNSSHSGSSASNAPVMSLSGSSSSIAPDVQTQMMLMLTESFSILSTVLVDKQCDTKT